MFSLYVEKGDDVIFAGFDDDFLVAGKGNDELYGRPEMICLRVERVQITLIVEMVLM